MVTMRELIDVVAEAPVPPKGPVSPVPAKAPTPPVPAIAPVARAISRGEKKAQERQQDLKDRGLNMVDVPGTGGQMKASQASVDRMARHTARQDVQDYESGQTYTPITGDEKVEFDGSGWKPITGDEEDPNSPMYYQGDEIPHKLMKPGADGSMDPGLPSTVTAQAQADAGTSLVQFKKDQDQRMQTRTGIAQPVIPGAEAGEGHIDPARLHSQQVGDAEAQKRAERYRDADPKTKASMDRFK